MSIGMSKDLVRSVFEDGFGAGRLDAVDAALADNADDRHPFAPDEPGMKEHLKNAIRMFRGAMPDLKVEVSDLIAEDDKIAARVLMTGTHTGTPIFGMPAAGTTISIEQFHLIQLDAEGKGLHHWASVGEDQLRRQLAASPASTPA
jgi:predicted ester cyclase